ncbi:hypothetical protein BSR42_03680 [Megasphaera cerevisiae]|nr:hypothetical protein BSR42_03680 [Megasphaera cerevisiae]
MKKYKHILTAAALTAVLGTSAFAANGVGLQDIDGYWGKAAIQYFYDNHYVSGTNGQFRPNEDLTREGVAAIVNNMLGEDTPVAATNFSDVKGRWSERAVSSLVDKQIMKGYSNGTFKPQQKVTREEFAVIAYNYMNYKGMSSSKTAVPYADENKISPWAKTAVDTLAAGGYMTGANNVFNPQQNITRGEAVNVLYRLVKNNAETTQGEVSLETKAFKDIKDVYGSVKNFAKDGIMYWQGGILHVGVKTDKNKDKLEDAFAADKDIPAESITVQRSTYSYNEYKDLMAQAEKIYKATEPTNTAIKTDVDYLNEKVVLTVPSISKETQANLNKALGSALRIVIQ